MAGFRVLTLGCCAGTDLSVGQPCCLQLDVAAADLRAARERRAQAQHELAHATSKVRRVAGWAPLLCASCGPGWRILAAFD